MALTNSQLLFNMGESGKIANNILKKSLEDCLSLLPPAPLVIHYIHDTGPSFSKIRMHYLQINCHDKC